MTKVRNKQLLIAFGNHLYRLRKGKQITQENLAYGADVPVSQIGRIERGETNPTLSSLYAMAKAMNVTLSKLMDFPFDLPETE